MNASNPNKRSLHIAAHALVWAVLFFLPYLLAAGETFNVLRIIRSSTLPLICSGIIFYINYLFLVDRLWFEKKKGRFVIINIILLVVFVTVDYQLRHVLEHLLPPRSYTERPFMLTLYIESLSLLMPMVFSTALRTYERLNKSEEERQQAWNEKLTSELQHLRYQLQPHFFFNSLNNIYSLIDLDPEKAKETVHTLAKLMRYMLYNTNSTMVSLAQELDFMKKYIQLMKLRTSDHTQVTVDFPDGGSHVQVAPLLFISLIENAFKHGVSATEISKLDFKLEIKDESLTFVSQNPNFPKHTNDKSGSGIGLENLRRRLSILYPKSHSFHIDTDAQWYRTTLTISTKAATDE